MTETQKHPKSDFDHVDAWIFDLDNTLYPAHCNLFAQVDVRMGTFISNRLGLTPADAKNLQKQYFRDYGTTMNGLMTEHNVDPEVFLDFVHDIDLSVVERDQVLSDALERLPGKKYIFTNACVSHASNVMDRLDVGHHFNDVFDIASAKYVPKPASQTYQAFVDQTGIDSSRAAMFEDLSRNLAVPHELGMTTVLITSDSNPDSTYLPPMDDDGHVHHVTDNLGTFLHSISANLQLSAD